MRLRLAATLSALSCSILVFGAGCANSGSSSGDSVTQPGLQTEVEWQDNKLLAIALTGAKGALEDEAAFQQRVALLANKTAAEACSRTAIYEPSHDANHTSGMGNSSRFTVRIYRCEDAK